MRYQFPVVVASDGRRRDVAIAGARSVGHPDAETTMSIVLAPTFSKAEYMASRIASKRFW
ncbi:hypothetical protein AMTR_s00002p00100490 [Amborella trichopoda]|uniref:Uncharacterized protein n=1 Tax=Amborella trichopoda TaxID=13333 RepID=W1NTS9_AMBTC|nr:hypothetical protein AMTR_s00002p00100490 [Amborella trichopoda]